MRAELLDEVSNVKKDNGFDFMEPDDTMIKSLAADVGLGLLLLQSNPCLRQHKIILAKTESHVQEQLCGKEQVRLAPYDQGQRINLWVCDLTPSPGTRVEQST